MTEANMATQAGANSSDDFLTSIQAAETQAAEIVTLTTERDDFKTKFEAAELAKTENEIKIPEVLKPYLRFEKIS